MKAAVGDEDEIRVEWVVTTGAPTAVSIQFTRRRAGNREYLQADFITWSTTPHGFAATADGSEWVYPFTWPVSAGGYQVTIRAIPTSTMTLPDQAIQYRVSHADTDDLHGRHVAKARSVVYVNDVGGASISFLYQKIDPTTGAPFTNAQVTAVSIAVHDVADGGVLLPSTPMVWDAVLQAYRYNWAYTGTARVVMAVLTPTRAAGVSAALTPVYREVIDMADVLARLGKNTEAATDPSAGTGTLLSKLRGTGDNLDANNSILASVQADTDALQGDAAALQADVNALQADLADGTHGLAAIQANIDAEGLSIRDRLNHPTDGLAALKAIAEVIRDRIGVAADAAGADTVRGQLRSILDNYLASGAHGLAALNTDLDNLLARLGVTADTGGSATTGTAMAKMNAIFQEIGILATALVAPDIEVDQPTPPQSG